MKYNSDEFRKMSYLNDEEDLASALHSAVDESERLRVKNKQLECAIERVLKITPKTFVEKNVAKECPSKAEPSHIAAAQWGWSRAIAAYVAALNEREKPDVPNV